LKNNQKNFKFTKGTVSFELEELIAVNPDSQHFHRYKRPDMARIRNQRH